MKLQTAKNRVLKGIKSKEFAIRNNLSYHNYSLINFNNCVYELSDIDREKFEIWYNKKK